MVNNYMEKFWEDILKERESRNLKRTLRRFIPLGPTRGFMGGKNILLFCTNNYLGLTHHPKVISAVLEAAQKWGTGAGSSPLISGYTQLHEELCEGLARFKGTEAALLFPSGYGANVGLISSLAGPEDVVFADRLIHASLLDGVRLSGAKLVRFRHNDIDHLEKLLTHHKGRRRLLVTEGVFSMEGDCAPLAQLAALAREKDLLLVVDDAHGTGVLGPQGRGTLADQKVEPAGIVITGTLSKALASVGGFVAGDRNLISFLVNKSRSFIFSTSPPPPAVAAALAALKLLEEDPLPLRLLRANMDLLARGLRDLGLPCTGETPIFPIILGSEESALKASSLLYDQGFYVPAIRPPTVPPGTCRLRISVSASHSPEEIRDLLKSLKGVVRELKC